MGLSVTWGEVRARRLARSFLMQRGPDVVAVARAVGGIHAQVQASAELQLCARVEGLTQQHVRDALWRDRTLVKSWALRGTLHLHPSGELPVWLAARARGPAELDEWRDPAGVSHPRVSAAEVAELREAVWEALDGRCLLREELTSEVVQRVGRNHEGRLRSGFAFFTSDLCQGPPQGAKITFARPDQWIDDWREIDRPDALRQVLQRFLYAYGPSRPAQFREWFQAEAPFDLVDVEEVDVEGHRAFVLAGDIEFPQPQKSVRLLPEYDVYVMGFREREHLVPPRVREQVAAHGRGRYEGSAGVSFLVIDGVAAGVWKRKKSAKRIEITVTPTRRVGRATIAEEVERIGAFYGLAPTITLARA